MAHILVVDDEPMLSLLVASILRPLGHQVTQAEDGVDALLTLKAASFDLLITDLMMPRMDGIQLIQIVGQQFPQLPIIVMSAFASTIPHTAQPYVKHYLTKPIARQQLVDTVQKLVASTT